MNVECEYCGRSFKVRGLKIHQNKCNEKKKTYKAHGFCFESENVNAFGYMLSFLSNQSIVKLQAATGACYNDSSAVVSSMCCPCENDELAIANGLCLACNKAQDPTFRDTITTTEARKVYGVQDIDHVPHKRYPSGYDDVFKYADLERYAVNTFGSKRAWLEHLAPKALRRQKALRAKKKAEENYQLPRDQAERYNLVSAELELLGRHIDNHLIDVMRFVLDNIGFAEHLAHLIDRNIKKKERRKRVEEELREFRKSLSEEFVSYLGSLSNRGLDLRSDNGLCHNYINNDEGVVDDIVDMEEEMKFLLDHTSYATKCSDIIPTRSHYDDDDYWVPASVLRDEHQERIKRRIRDEYLLDSRGLELPLKWQRLARPKSPRSSSY